MERWILAWALPALTGGALRDRYRVVLLNLFLACGAPGFPRGLHLAARHGHSPRRKPTMMRSTATAVLALACVLSVSVPLRADEAEDKAAEAVMSLGVGCTVTRDEKAPGKPVVAA